MNHVGFTAYLKLRGEVSQGEGESNEQSGKVSGPGLKIPKFPFFQIFFCTSGRPLSDSPSCKWFLTERSFLFLCSICLIQRYNTYKACSGNIENYPNLRLEDFSLLQRFEELRAIFHLENAVKF